MKTKKLITLLLIVSVLSLSFLTDTNVAHAQWGETHCPGLDTCYGCSANDCQVYTVQKITQTFTKQQCKEIANRASSISDWSSYVSLIVGVKKPVSGAVLALYGMNVSKNAKMFEYAAVKNKGIKLSYEYVINKRSYSLNKYRKGTFSYI